MHRVRETDDAPAACSGCGAIWMPEAAADLVRTVGVSTELADFLKAADREPLEPGLIEDDGYRARSVPTSSCPVCASLLVERVDRGVRLRECPTGHGTFLGRRAARAWTKNIASEMKARPVSRGVAGCLLTLFIVGSVLVFAIGICASSL